MSGVEKLVMQADPNRALEDYLEGLFAGSPSPPEPVPAKLHDSPKVATVVRPQRAEPLSRPLEVGPRPVSLNGLMPRLAPPQPPVEHSLKGRELVPLRAAPRRAGPPDWADEPFPCLLFRASGLTLAVPLVHLNGVLPWSDEITPMPGHRPWFLGLVQHQQSSVKVIDTAAVVVPSDRPQSVSKDSERQLGNIVLIDDGSWGLACDAVEEMITLEPGGVRWRSAAGKRPWLAGTVIERMCALLDVSAFAEMLTTGER